MTLKPASHALTLLRLSRKDAKVLDFEVDSEIAGFHAQQAIEKAIKAILTAYGVDYPFIHSLPRLAGLLLPTGVSLPETPYRLEDLTEYAVALRYDEPPEAFEPNLPQLRATVEILLGFAQMTVESKLAGQPS